MGGGGQLVGQVAQVVLDLAEGLSLGEVHQALRHAAEGLLGVGLQAAEEVLDAGFPVIGGRGGVRRERVHGGAHPGEEPTKGYEFPISRRAYHDGPIFSPTFPERTPGAAFVGLIVATGPPGR